MFHGRCRNALVAMLPAMAPAIAFAGDPPASGQANVVVVSGSRVEHASFDLPASVDLVDAARIGQAQPRVNASEALAAVPGLTVLNRQNYAQDLQISSRGFGARSAFGVRGVRLLADGIPATMPDGQGQAATFNLDTAQRIEVLRGPFSAVYGNHSGGVIQLFTRDGASPATVELNTAAGSDGIRKLDLNAQGQSGAIGYVLDASRFNTDGYRNHSAARRDQSYAKLSLAPSASSRLALVAGTLRQDDTQDPLGVTLATLLRDPRAGETDLSDPATPPRTFAERYNTRKSIAHEQLGLAYTRHVGPDRLSVTVYRGNRHVVQYQSFSKAFQQAASHSGGVVDFERAFGGMDLNWLDVRPLAGGELRTTAGFEYASSSDDRGGFENFIGDEFGVKGRLRRDEQDDLESADPYLQAEWQRGKWVLTGGVRHNRLQVHVCDRYLANGDDSGSLSFRRTTPVAAALYKVTPTLNLYVSAARGFETPTLNELFYSGAGGGFNFGLRPATSRHLELGAKTILGANARLDAALFQARTSDELVVDSASGGRTSYRNAARTLRQGLELSLDVGLGGGFSTRVAATALRAIYDEGFGTVARGNRLPGVPSASMYAELAWKNAHDSLGGALEAVASARMFPDDANSAIPAPGYAVLHARLQARQHAGRWRLKQFVRINNLLDRRYVGSLIVGDASKRFYEPAPGRNWVLGFSVQYVFSAP